MKRSHDSDDAGAEAKRSRDEDGAAAEDATDAVRPGHWSSSWRAPLA